MELYKSDAISSVEEDALGRKPFIEAVANFIKSQSTEVNKDKKKELRNLGDPLTIGIYGKWGYGKTSVIRCVESEIKSKFFTAYYNPWMYNSEEDLIKHLFETIISSVKGTKNRTKRNSLTKSIGKYFLHFIKGVKADVKFGTNLAPIQPTVGVNLQSFADEILKDINKEETVYDVKEQINDVLKSLSNPIVIFIDDIDRLSKTEIYTLFKTVRLIADFKNIIYVLSFDDEMVAKSIKDNFADGKEEDGFNYLEKIIDMPLRMPQISGHNLDNFFRVKLGIETNIPATPFHNKLNTITHYLLESPRDCIRIANSITLVKATLGDNIDTEDLILIESLRVKSSSLFWYVIRYFQEMVVNNDADYFGNRYNAPARLGKFLEVDGVANRAIMIWQNFFRYLLRVDIINSRKIEVLTKHDEVQRVFDFSVFNEHLNDSKTKLYNPLVLEKYLKFASNLD